MSIEDTKPCDELLLDTRPRRRAPLGESGLEDPPPAPKEIKIKTFIQHSAGLEDDGNDGTENVS
ncbi:MAG: hypothetical protein COX81_03555 [Candidatus Magasanikbacteria bacterium CG_4_10_14_0_2_um_filter_37_12]|uniref:Uncharacterized protein n=1 Tax=Candidatus Magasanikbacteria bacterium CG_4_10_14_0_2_um_filter_37_12 TaxID=1974637 RepID=A0A2M7V6Z5_9BACT|nr:MAG: hypothetical protein COX81_03555 [Candidatus Magasanikbacteria bacterium CG_4_10_14_0_2_um_filter_37_12]